MDELTAPQVRIGRRIPFQVALTGWFAVGKTTILRALESHELGKYVGVVNPKDLLGPLEGMPKSSADSVDFRRLCRGLDEYYAKVLDETGPVLARSTASRSDSIVVVECSPWIAKRWPCFDRIFVIDGCVPDCVDRLARRDELSPNVARALVLAQRRVGGKIPLTWTQVNSAELLFHEIEHLLGELGCRY